MFTEDELEKIYQAYKDCEMPFIKASIRQYRISRVDKECILAYIRARRQRESREKAYRRFRRFLEKHPSYMRDYMREYLKRRNNNGD